MPEYPRGDVAWSSSAPVSVASLFRSDHTTAGTDLAWLREQLARFTYRPGWTMTIEEPFLPGAIAYQIKIAYPVVDSRDQRRTIEVGGRFVVPPMIAEERDEKLFAHWLASTLLDCEWHESREWLRRDGDIYDDPHSEQRP